MVKINEAFTFESQALAKEQLGKHIEQVRRKIEEAIHDIGPPADPDEVVSVEFEGVVKWTK
jgi:hypothetical protein